ncbi:MAG: noncanonical pyrimidine nucleotidase, YjjG family [Lachnospiraceae bacterium]|nr:noncanonical pyrimidine nucleotidase, YjjG family [Lachnospiraceae bacterium]
MSRFTTVLWDVDNTLLDFAYSQRRALAACFRSVGRDMTEETLALYEQINDDYWRRLELGEVTKKQLLMGRFVSLFQKLEIEDVDVAQFQARYQEGLGTYFAFLDDSLTVCRSLQGRVKQYVITNGVTSSQKTKLELSGLADVMDDIFISEAVGSPKPQKQFFDYCLERIEEKDKSRILIVGDSLTSDIKGGIQAGIPTCWYRRESGAMDEILGAGCKPDYKISDLHMVYDILGLPG